MTIEDISERAQMVGAGLRVDLATNISPIDAGRLWSRAGAIQLMDNTIFRALRDEHSRHGATRAFRLGDRVTKTRGACWTGRVVGFYSTTHTPAGYCVESDTERGSVQIYPEAALKLMPGPDDA